MQHCEQQTRKTHTYILTKAVKDEVTHSQTHTHTEHIKDRILGSVFHIHTHTKHTEDNFVCL